MLDTIIIVDSVPGRAREIQEAVKDHAEQVKIIDLRKGELVEARLRFASEVSQVLSDKKPLMVIFNMVALVKTNVIQILKSMEKMEKVGSRRIFVSCKGAKAFKDALKAGKLDPKEFRRIGYDDEQNYLPKLKALFRNQDNTRSA